MARMLLSETRTRFKEDCDLANSGMSSFRRRCKSETRTRFKEDCDVEVLHHLVNPHIPSETRTRFKEDCDIVS